MTSSNLATQSFSRCFLRVPGQTSLRLRFSKIDGVKRKSGKCTESLTDRETDREAARETDGETDGETDREADRDTDRETNGETE